MAYCRFSTQTDRGPSQVYVWVSSENMPGRFRQKYIWNVWFLENDRHESENKREFDTPYKAADFLQELADKEYIVPKKTIEALKTEKLTKGKPDWLND